MKMYPQSKGIINARGIKIDFSQILDDRGQLDWKHSKGKKILFERKNQKDFFICEEYINATNSSGAYIILTYHSKQYKASTTSIKGGSFTFLDYDDWEYNIGDRIKIEDLDITIIDRKRDDKNYYKIFCNKCHFDSNSYYYRQEFREEYWIDYNHIQRLKHCPCCRGAIVKPGINDIYTINPQLIKFLVNKEDGYKNTKCSCKISGLKCPDCGQKLHTSLSNIYYFGNPCICNDGYSYPNRMLYFTILQLDKIVDEWQREYNPDWLYPKRFDMYVKYHGIKYIIEMDGGLGHGNDCYSLKNYKNRLAVDQEKDTLAKKHNYIVIRIPCNYKYLTEIKDVIYKYLKDIFPLDMINWDDVFNNCFRNIHKQICEDYENTNMSVDEIAKKYHYSRSGINPILRNGYKLGWCPSYTKGSPKYNHKRLSQEELDQFSIADKILLENPTISQKEISQKVGLSIDRLNNHWKKSGLLEKSKQNGRGKSKEVYVYNDDGIINKYSSTAELVFNSLTDFGKQFDAKNIQAVCSGRRKRYMGLYFSYNPIEVI